MGGGQPVSLFGEEQIDQYTACGIVSISIGNYYYDQVNNKSKTVTNYKSLTDSFIFYNNSIAGCTKPEFTSEGILCYGWNCVFKDELPDPSNGAHYQSSEYSFVLTSNSLNDEDPTSWHFGETQLVYKSNNIKNEYKEPPFVWVYMTPIIKQITTSPYKLLLCTTKIVATYNEDGTFSFSQSSTLNEIFETTQIIDRNGAPDMEMEVFSRFDDVDEFVYGVVGVNSKILESAFWCIDGRAFKYDIVNDSLVQGGDVYSRSGWGSVGPTTDYYYIPDLREFRPDISNTSYSATFVVDTLELLDYDDSGWGDREKDLYKLSKYRYNQKDVWWNGQDNYSLVGYDYCYGIGFGYSNPMIGYFDKVPKRYDRKTQQSTYYPYKDSYYGAKTFTTTENCCKVICEESFNDNSKDLIYFTDVLGSKYFAVIDSTTGKLSREYLPYSGIFYSKHDVSSTSYYNSCIFYKYGLGKPCFNVTNYMNEFNIGYLAYIQGNNVPQKFKGRLDVFYPNTVDTYGYNPFLLRDSEQLV